MNEITNRDSEPQQELQQIQEAPEQKIEAELSPEVVEKIMAKAQDVHKKGTAYHGIVYYGESVNRDDRFQENFKRLQIALKTGLLGAEGLKDFERGTKLPKETVEENEDLIKKQWVKNLRGLSPKERREMGMGGGVYFTLSKPDVNDIKYLNAYGGQRDSIAILFDYKDVKGKDDYSRISPYSVEGPSAGESTINFRVAPRFFKGIAFEPGRVNIFSPEQQKIIDRFIVIWEKCMFISFRNKTLKNQNELRKFMRMDIDKADEEEFLSLVDRINEEGLGDLADYYSWTEKGDEPTEEMKKQRAGEIARAMVDLDGGKTDLIVPIYDTDGNLWWPKQMSYEEVKKFVAERDAKKEK